MSMNYPVVKHRAVFQKRAKAGELTTEEKAKLIALQESGHAWRLLSKGFTADIVTIAANKPVTEYFGDNDGCVGALFPISFENFQKVCIAALARCQACLTYTAIFQSWRGSLGTSVWTRTNFWMSSVPHTRTL